MSVAHDLTAAIYAPMGIGDLRVAGQMGGAGLPLQIVGTVLSLQNPRTPSAGVLGSLTAGRIAGASVKANTIGTVRVSGDLADSELDVAGFTGPASAPVGLAILSVAGDLVRTTLNVTDGIDALTVGGTVTDSTILAAYDRARPAAEVKALTVGAWESSVLTANSVHAFTVAGNAGLGLPGNVTDSTILLIGERAGVALGTFLATGTVSGSAYQVSGGNVTSFTTAFFKNSTLFLGYAPVNPPALADAANNQTPTNWEGTFVLGSFRTTAALDPADVPDTASFQSSTVVAGRLGTVSLSGVDPDPAGPDQQTFGVGFRAGGGAAGTLTVAGVARPNPTTLGKFRYFGLLG
jgi:hypothetical protein